MFQNSPRSKRDTTFNLSSEVYFLIVYMFIFLFSLHVNQAHTIGFIGNKRGHWEISGTSINRGVGFRGPESIKALCKLLVYNPQINYSLISPCTETLIDSFNLESLWGITRFCYEELKRDKTVLFEEK